MTAASSRLRQWGQRKIPTPVALIILIAVVSGAMFLVFNHWAKYASHMNCKARRFIIARAEEEYWQKHHALVTGDDQALQALVESKQLPKALPCQHGGHYTVVDNGDGSITIHCSLPEHDVWYEQRGVHYRIRTTPIQKP